MGVEEEILPVITGDANEIEEDEKIILKTDLNIARRQTLTNLIIKKQTLQHAFDDNDDYDYEKEFLEMENNAKISKFFDKAKERLRYYFNMFRRKTENYVEDIEEEIIDETQNDKKEGLNKLKNIMDNANKNKGMKALKDNQKNEKIKENLNKFNKIMVDKEKQKGMDVLKDNQKTEIKKEKLNKLGDIFQQKSKSKVMNALKQNKKDEEIKEQLTKLNTLIIEKEKNKAMTALKQKQNEENIKTQITLINKIIEEKQKEEALNSLKKNQEDEKIKEHLLKISNLITEKQKIKVMTTLKQKEHDEQVKTQLEKLNELMEKKEKEIALEILNENTNEIILSDEEYNKKMRQLLFIKIISHIGYHYLLRKLLYFLNQWIKNSGIKRK
jgi:hypothetical protein